MTDDNDDDTIPCKYCGKLMFEDSPRCPRCGKYISAEDDHDDEDIPAQKPWWLLIGVAFCLYAVYRWIMLG